jgi:hypothetical protein
MTTSVGSSALVTRAWNGIVAGLAGGIVFGIMMTTMGMMSTIAMMVGSSSVAISWLVHLIISAFYGALFAFVVPTARAVGALLGAGACTGSCRG